MFGLFMYCFVSQQQIAFGQLKACPWLVQSAVYFSHINDPNDNSGGGRSGSESEYPTYGFPCS